MKNICPCCPKYSIVYGFGQLSHTLLLFEFMLNAQYLRYSPCLREATFGKMGRDTSEYLRNATWPRIAQVVLERLQQGERGLKVAIDAIVFLDLRAHEPGPHGPLVVCAICRAWSPP